MNDAFETGKSLVDDLISGDLTVKAEQQGCQAILQLLHEKGSYFKYNYIRTHYETYLNVKIQFLGSC